MSGLHFGDLNPLQAGADGAKSRASLVGCLEIVVEFVIQILKKAAKLASEAEARRREAWAGAQRGQLAFPRPRDARIVLGFHLYKYLCKPQEISISIVNLLRSVTTQK